MMNRTIFLHVVALALAAVSLGRADEGSRLVDVTLDYGGGGLYLYPGPNPQNVCHLWSLEKLPNGDYLIKPRGQNRCLDANNGEGSPYLNPNPHPDQMNHRWQIVKEGSHHLILSRKNGGALDACGGNGLYINTKIDKSNPNILWRLQPHGDHHLLIPVVQRDQWANNRCSPYIEARIKQSWRDHEAFKWHQLDHKWDEKKWCGAALGHQNNGHWRNDGYGLTPDCNSLKVTIDPNRTKLRAEFTVNARGDFHHILWESGVRSAEMRVEAKAKLQFVIDFDGARNPNVRVTMNVTERDIKGGGALQGIAEAAFTIGEMVARAKVNEYESEINKVISGYLANK